MRIEPSTARSKLKSNALTDCAMGAINESTSRVRKFHAWSHGRPWFSLYFRYENVDNKIYCVVCIMFGIANKKYVKRPDSNSYLGQLSLS